jgi:hypothetical protein
LLRDAASGVVHEDVDAPHVSVPRVAAASHRNVEIAIGVDVRPRESVGRPGHAKVLRLRQVPLPRVSQHRYPMVLDLVQRHGYRDVEPPIAVEVRRPHAIRGVAERMGDRGLEVRIPGVEEDRKAPREAVGGNHVDAPIGVQVAERGGEGRVLRGQIFGWRKRAAPQVQQHRDGVRSGADGCKVEVPIPVEIGSGDVDRLLARGILPQDSKSESRRVSREAQGSLERPFRLGLAAG